MSLVGVWKMTYSFVYMLCSDHHYELKSLSMKVILLFILSLASTPTMSISGSIQQPTEHTSLVQHPAVDSLKSLQLDLDRIFSNPAFRHAQWGVEVFSIDRSEMFYEKDSLRLLIPASNNKIITAAVALMRLGPEYRFETRIMTDGEIVNGILRGNLLIVSAGDPSHSSQFQSEDPFGLFGNWAEKLKDLGVRAIEGDIIGDGGAFDGVSFGHGWEWEDLTHSYAAPVSAFQFNDNMLALRIAPASKEGGAASIDILPLEDFLKINNSVVTEARGTRPFIQIKRGNSNDAIAVSGSVPLNGKALIRNISVPSPILYYMSALKHTLSEEGIDTSTCGLREMRVYNSASLFPLWSHSSPALSEILKPLMKESENLYAETLTRTLGLVFGQKGTFSEGKGIVEDTLGQIGIEAESYSYADGSGLSRLNLVSADVLVRILRAMYEHRHFVPFYQALSIAGVDGTLENRMKGKRAENNLHAKTGTISNASAISGYLYTADGEMLAFSIMVNNYLESRKQAEFLQDKAIERLANFSRNGESR